MFPAYVTSRHPYTIDSVAAGHVGIGLTRRTGVLAYLRPPYLDKVTRIEVTGARVPPFPFPTYYPTRAPVCKQSLYPTVFLAQPFVTELLRCLTRLHLPMQRTRVYK